MAQPTPRTAARVLLIDDAHRVLLLHGTDPADPTDAYWLAPGGGLEPGETPAQAAARELFEETGLRLDAAALGEPVLRNVVEFSFQGRAYRQEQDYFLARVPDWAVDTARLDGDEHAFIDGHRWWTVPELAATTETVYPAGLPELLRSLVEV